MAPATASATGVAVGPDGLTTWQRRLGCTSRRKPSLNVLPSAGRGYVCTQDGREVDVYEFTDAHAAETYYHGLYDQLQASAFVGNLVVVTDLEPTLVAFLNRVGKAG